MAQPMLNVGGNLPPEILQQQQALNRQQQMAQLLMQQGQSMPSGQMVSGRYVAPSFFQYAAPLFQTYAGTKLAEKGDKAQADLAKALRQQYASEMTQYQDLLRGKEQVFEQAGPTQGGGNIPNQTYRAGGSPESAYLFGSTAYNPVLQQLSAKKLTEGPQWKEASKLDAQGNTISGYVDMNASSPESTFRPFAMTKMGISPAEQIRLADEGIGIPAQFRGGAVGQPQGQPTSAYGANVQFTPNQAVVAPQGQPSGQPQPQTQVSLQTKTQPFTLQRFGYDPFKGGDLPTDMSAKDVRAFKAEQNKPITGDAAKTVSGATNYIDSLNRYRDYMNTLTPQDLVNPQVRAQLETKHKQVLLTGKEANNLGVLNGGDERILNAVMPNYSDIMITKNTLNKVIDDQMQFGSGAIVAQYRTAEKSVPERLRKYVEIEMPKPEQKSDGKDLQSQLRSKGIPYQPKLYEYRVNPDGSVDRKRKIL